MGIFEQSYMTTLLFFLFTMQYLNSLKFDYLIPEDYFQGTTPILSVPPQIPTRPSPPSPIHARGQEIGHVWMYVYVYVYV